MKPTEINMPEMKISYANVAENCHHVLADNCFFNLFEHGIDFWDCFESDSLESDYESYANIFIVSEDSADSLYRMLPKNGDNLFLYCEEYDLHFWLCKIPFTLWNESYADCTFEEFCNEF